MARTEQAYSSTTTAPQTQRLWQSMRVMRRFSLVDLITTAEAGESASEKYVRYLSRAGYLALSRGRVNGRAGSRNVWQLVRDSGPHAPIVRWDRTGVFDPNTQRVWRLPGLVAATSTTKGAAS